MRCSRHFCQERPIIPYFDANVTPTECSLRHHYLQYQSSKNEQQNTYLFISVAYYYQPTLEVILCLHPRAKGKIYVSYHQVRLISLSFGFIS